MELENLDNKELKEQPNNRPWLYKKGQSGNPKGRPPGTFSLKEYVKKKLASMTESEREEFLEGIDKRVIWEMAENKPKQDTDVMSGGEKIAFNIVNYGNTDTASIQPEELPNTTPESTG